MKIRGIIPAMVTPLNENGINEEGTRKLVRHLIAGGVHGLFILGTNGEFHTLSKEEKIQFAKIVVDEVSGRVPVFAGAGDIATNKVIELVNEFAKIGVDAASIITPYLLKYTDEELIHHYRVITEQTTLPIILYNIPPNTRNFINRHVFSELLKIDSIIGIKDSSGDLENFKGYLELNHREDFSLLMGSDSKILEALQLGADGSVASTANVVTKTDVAIYEQFVAGNIEQARQAQASIDDFREACKCSTIPSGLKYCLRAIGQDVGLPKLPVLDLTKEEKQQVDHVLQKYVQAEGFTLKVEQ